MSPGSSTESYPAFARIVWKKPQPGNLPRPGSNPGHLVSQPDALTVTPQLHLKKHGDGRRTSDEMIANAQAAYERSPRKSLRRASRELQVPKSTLQGIVHKRLELYAHKRLKLYAHKMQLLQRLEPDDKPKRVEFANTMLDRLGADPVDFLLWGYVKDKVYATPIRDLRYLRGRIIEAIESIPEDMLQRAWQEIVHRLDIVTVTAGAHVEIRRECCSSYGRAAPGCKASQRVKEMVTGVKTSPTALKLSVARDSQRIVDSIRKGSKSFQSRKKMLKFSKTKAEETMKKSEGPTYRAGQF
ncbi:hypothetical protein ANN_19592 [Periplaneta americana]|uniref:Uncharacterized protein n=1 Tax=Periplaneta americana TaxID=6978 RepID=A0ABQ8SAW0_PERAM|nr:hypothetical protein ANN_19592 [Periplaneta americana]